MTVERVRNFLSNERNNGRGTDAEALLRHLESFNGECAYCGHPMATEGWDHIDHVDPVYNGGAGTIENLLPACVACNVEKGHFNADGWYHRLSTQRPHWPGALHPKAIEVRAAHGLDEPSFLALRATSIAEKGEGRMREDERRAREEAERLARLAEFQREQDMKTWRAANRSLIEAEARRIAEALPPREVEVEVERIVEVERPRYSWRVAVAAASVAAIVALGVGYGVAASAVEPEVVTETVTKTRTVTKTIPVVRWKTKWKTRAVTKYVTKYVEAKPDQGIEDLKLDPPPALSPPPAPDPCEDMLTWDGWKRCAERHDRNS